MQNIGGMKSNSILSACDNYLRGGAKVKKKKRGLSDIIHSLSSTAARCADISARGRALQQQPRKKCFK